MEKHVLMIKECQITGLKYLCKSSGKTDPFKYQGSGIRWTNHLKKYHENWSRSNKIKTTIIGIYYNKEDLKRNGLYCSSLYNVVDDPNWANLIPEQGDGGFVNNQTGRHWKVKDTSKMKNKKTITEDVLNARKSSLEGKNNYQFKGWYVTPYGTFESVVDAVAEGLLQREKGNKEVLTSEESVRNYCRLKNSEKLNPEGRRTPKNWRGKTPKEIGFGFIKKDEVN